jgi:hypothetical protein
MKVKNEKTSQSELLSRRPFLPTLLQPLRLNRDSPPSDEKEKETTRSAVTKSRAYWEACR